MISTVSDVSNLISISPAVSNQFGTVSFVTIYNITF